MSNFTEAGNFPPERSMMMVGAVPPPSMAMVFVSFTVPSTGPDPVQSGTVILSPSRTIVTVASGSTVTVSNSVSQRAGGSAADACQARTDSGPRTPTTTNPPISRRLRGWRATERRAASHDPEVLRSPLAVVLG